MLRARLALPLLLTLAAACGDGGSDNAPDDVTNDASDTAADATGDAPADVPDAAADSATDPAPDLPPEGDICSAMEQRPRAFDTVGPYGLRRHDLAADFTLPLVDGSTWTLSENWSGCESYVFMPDTIPLSDTDGTSVWEEGVAGLIEMSPRNAHYFFISRRNAAEAASSATAMQARVDEALAALTPLDAEHWRSRLHVVSGAAASLDAWVAGSLQSGVGQLGLTIDRFQRVRAVGSIADVRRYDPELAAQDMWPWERNLAFAANEVRHYNFEARRQRELDAVDATTVTLWQGEVIEQFADMEVELPSAADMATFDTLELDFTQRCPNPNALEAGNCGAWDYLAHLWLAVGEGEDVQRIELARHITTYHREGRWIVDITPALYHLREGGTRSFRWEWAPEWNTQPTATWLTLRFSNQNKGYRPIAVTELWSGKAFNAAYNDERAPIDVAIPAEATRTELRAIITGHGAETNQCAEFCNHQHEFIVEGRSFYREHEDTIGNDLGCMEQIDMGAVPNQWGTWWFGRGGWCPGMQVDPFIVDLSELATPGESINVDYFGWLGGRTPPDNAGNIVLSSFVVSYGE